MTAKKYTTKSYGTAQISYKGAMISGVFNREQAALILTDAMQMKALFDTMDVCLANAMKQTPTKGKKK
jgi:hypothetical protein